MTVRLGLPPGPNVRRRGRGPRTRPASTGDRPAPIADAPTPATAPRSPPPPDWRRGAPKRRGPAISPAGPRYQRRSRRLTSRPSALRNWSLAVPVSGVTCKSIARANRLQGLAVTLSICVLFTHIAYTGAIDHERAGLI